MDDYSTAEVSEQLISDIKQSLAGKEYGSIEIYIESGRVVQITERVIKKTLRSGESNNKKEFVYWKPIRNRKWPIVW